MVVVLYRQDQKKTAKKTCRVLALFRAGLVVAYHSRVNDVPPPCLAHVAFPSFLFRVFSSFARNVMYVMEQTGVAAGAFGAAAAAAATAPGQAPGGAPAEAGGAAAGLSEGAAQRREEFMLESLVCAVEILFFIYYSYQVMVVCISRRD